MTDDRHPDDQLPDRAAGLLPGETAAQVDAHVAACPRCAADLAELRAIATALGPDREAAAPPETFDAILRRLDAPPPSTLDLATIRAARQEGRRRSLAAGLLAGAAVAAAFVLVIVSITRPAGQGSLLAHDSPELVLLAAADATDELASVSLTATGRVQLTPIAGEESLSDLSVALDISAEGALAAPDQVRMTVAMEGSGPLGGVIPDTRHEHVAVGDDVWTRQNGGPWQPGEPEVPIDLPSVEEPARILRAAAEEAQDLTDGGVVTIDGVETREVSFIAPAQMVGLDLLLDEDAPVHMTVYVQDDGRLRRSVLAVDSDIVEPLPARMTMELTTNYHGHNRPVDITVP